MDYTCITTFYQGKAPPTMMIKCQKCGFENQMGSIFCRECGEKLNMDAIDPNKLQKDVNKEKNIKLAKKRIKSAISSGIALIVVAAFVGVVFYNGGLRKYEEPETADAVARQKFNEATNGTSVGKKKYSYPEVNKMLKTMVVDPIYEIPSFAKVTAVELAYDEAKNQPIIYMWVSIKDKVPVNYTIHGEIVYNPPPENAREEAPDPITLDVSRLDIGRLPIFVNTQPFLKGFSTLLQNEAVHGFLARAKSVEFSPDGMTVDFQQGGPTSTYTPPSSNSNKPSSSTAAAALKGGSAAAAEKNEAARQKAEAARQKAEEEKEKKRLQEEERKRKAEEYKQQQKEKEEERKRKLEEEKERKKQEAEEKKRQAEEEAERRRREREDRRNDRYNNNNGYGNSRSSRSSRSSRNRY